MRMKKEGWKRDLLNGPSNLNEKSLGRAQRKMFDLNGMKEEIGNSIINRTASDPRTGM